MAISTDQEADVLRLLLCAMSTVNDTMPIAGFISQTTAEDMSGAELDPADPLVRHKRVLKDVATRQGGLFQQLSDALADDTPVAEFENMPRNVLLADQLRTSFSSLQSVFSDVFGEDEWGGDPPHPRGEAVEDLTF